MNRPRTNKPETSFDFMLEQLENRQMLAGNVVATLNDAGDLKISGDDLDNDVFVIFEEGQISVSGENGTTVNGKSFESFFAEELRDVTIRMRDGDDSLNITAGSPMMRNVTVDMGTGVDSLTSGGLNTSGNVSLKLGSGKKGSEQSLTLRGSHASSERMIGGNLTITGGADRDVLMVGDDSGIAQVAGKTSINMGGGANEVKVENLQGQNNLKIGGGSGEDVVILTGDDWEIAANVSINTGAGVDDVTLELKGGDFDNPNIAFVVGGNAKINTGGAADDVTLNNFQTEGNLNIKIGSGDKDGDQRLSISGGDVGSTPLAGGSLTVTGGANRDVVLFTGYLEATYSDVNIRAGGGNDFVAVQGIKNSGTVVEDGLKIDMGGGDDVVVMDQVSARPDTILIGGNGFDELMTNSEFDLKMRGFESVVPFFDEADTLF